MSKAIDLGTSNILSAKDDGKGGVEVGCVRNCFLTLDDEPFQEAMLDNSPGANYVKKDGKLHVLGDFALPLGAALKEKVRRPMWKGMLNKKEPDAAAMLKIMATQLIGPAAYKGEILAMTCPESPMDDTTLDVTFHRQITVKWFEELGYEVRPINEAVGVGFELKPTMETTEGNLPLTGIALSLGGGMTNGVKLIRGMPLTPFSISKGGDYIDKKASDAMQLSPEKFCMVKEKKIKLADNTIVSQLDLADSNQQDVRYGALYVYYQNLIEHIVDMLQTVLASDPDNRIEDPCDVVIAGGTASPRGFSKMFSDICKKKNLGFPVKSVKVADDPIKCIVIGSLKISKLEERRAAKEKDKNNQNNNTVNSEQKAVQKVIESGENKG